MNQTIKVIICLISELSRNIRIFCEDEITLELRDQRNDNLFYSV